VFPGRLPWIALGSGQALNEAATGLAWPDKQERNARLREGAEIMRALLAGETVTQHGRLSAAEAKLWTRPERPTRLVGATTNAATAEWLGGWADGLLTVRASTERVRGIATAFQRGGGDGKPMHLKVDLSWAPTEAEALHQAHEHWRFNLLGSDVNWELRSPAAFEQAARFVRPDDMREAVLISADLGQHAAWLAECAALGFESLNLHNVGTNQRAFLDAFGRHVLPSLRTAGA